MNNASSKAPLQFLFLLVILGVFLLPPLYGRNQAEAYRVNDDLLRKGFGEGSLPEDVCSVAFDTYLLNFNTWENRLGNFADALFEDALSNVIKYAKCNLGFFDKIVTPAFLGSSAGGVSFQSPKCTNQISGGDVTGALQDAAERTLVYDLMTRCTARATQDAITDNALRVVNENGREGGPTWVTDYNRIISDAEVRGNAKARNSFMHTEYCSWLQGPMQGLFNFDPRDARALSSYSDNGSEPYTQRARCSFPAETTSAQLSQYPASIYYLSLPQNNLQGSYLMAQEEIREQIARERTADITEVTANRGYFGSRGTNAEESCAVRNEQGVCLQYSSIIQPGSNLAGTVDNIQNAEFRWIATSDEMGELVGDMQPRILQRLENLSRPSIDIEFEPDPAQRRYVEDSGEPEDPSTAACTQEVGAAGYCGMPSQTQCTCLHQATLDVCEPNRSNEATTTQNTANIILNDPLGAFVRQEVGNLTTQNGNTFLVNGSNRQFITAFCFFLGESGAGTCKTESNPAHDDILVLTTPAGQELSVDVITAGGAVRTNGFTVKFSCDPGFL